MQLDVYEYIIWHPAVVSAEVVDETFEDFYPKHKRRGFIDLGHASKDRNCLGLLLSDYRCKKCGYLAASTFSNGRKMKQCLRCRTRFA